MSSHLPQTSIQKIEAALRAEKSKFAKAFHQGKSMTELKDVVDKIHRLEKKFNALNLQNYSRQ